MFFLQVLLPSEEIGSWWGVSMLIVNSSGHKVEVYYTLGAVCSWQIKFTLFTGKYFPLLLCIPLFLIH